jgi:2'-5' RNA ligase
MNSSDPGARADWETALLLTVPTAESVIGQHRRPLDPAAADEIPPHVTVLYPFVPFADLNEDDHRLLARLFAGTGPLDLRFERTAWFGDSVLYLEIGVVDRVRTLTQQVVDVFPGHPPYGGDVPLDSVVPHLTIGTGTDHAALAAAERDVQDALPFAATVNEAQLWAGPAVGGRHHPAPWTCVRCYGC